MFDFLFPNHPFGGHTLRLVAQAQQGGGDVFDIARAMKNVEPGDKAAWERVWLELAAKTEAREKQALFDWLDQCEGRAPYLLIRGHLYDLFADDLAKRVTPVLRETGMKRNELVVLAVNPRERSADASAAIEPLTRR